MIARIATPFVLLMFTSLALAQQEVRVPPRLPNEGTEIFRGLLNFSGVESVPRTSPTSNLQSHIVIVYGKPRDFDQTQHISNIIGEVSRNGGAVFIAMNEPFEFRNFQIHQLAIREEHTNLRCYNENAAPEELTPAQRIYCPYVSSKPFGWQQLNPIDNSPAWNPFRGFGRIATNRPAVLMDSRTQNSPTPLAYLPSDCVAEDRNGPKIPANAKFALFYNQGNAQIRDAMIVADEHILSNQMIAMPGTDNLPFALKLISTLKGNGGGNPSGKPIKAYFFEYGEQKYQFDDVKFNVKPSPTPPSIPILPPAEMDKLLTPIADALTDQLDKNDAHNRLISQNRFFYARLMKYVVICLVAFVMLLLLWRLMFNQYRKDRTALPSSPLARIKPARGLVGHMRQDLLMQGNYGTIVRDYIRDLFHSLGLPAGSSAQIPPVHYKGNPENKPALQTDLNKLWSIAFGPPPKVTIADWKTLEPVLLRVWKAAEAGRWNFAATPENS